MTNHSNHQEHIGARWIVAILALLALLILGFVLYLRMGVRIDGRHRSELPAHVAALASSRTSHAPSTPGCS